MAASDVNTAMAAAASAVGSGDYSSALTYARKAWAYLLALPNSKHATTEMEWDRESIKDFIREIERASAASTGIQRTKVTKTRVESTE